MKKFSQLIIYLVVLLAFMFIYDKVDENATKSEYDLIIVGNNCNCQVSGTCKHTYGIKNGTSHNLNSNYKRDLSNVYKVVRSNDMITYFDYDTWYDMYDDLGHVDYCSDCTDKYNKTVKEAHEKYNYKEKDLKIFNNILNIIDGNNIKYYIITDKNHYVFAYVENKHSIFKYNEEYNTLDFLIDLQTCDIDYFYEK